MLSIYQTRQEKNAQTDHCSLHGVYWFLNQHGSGRTRWLLSSPEYSARGRASFSILVVLQSFVLRTMSFSHKLDFQSGYSGFGSMCCKQAARGRSALQWCKLSEVSVEASEPLGEPAAMHLHSFAWQRGRLKCHSHCRKIFMPSMPCYTALGKTASETCVYCLCQEVSKQGFCLASDALRRAVRKLSEVIIVPSLQARTERVQNRLTFLDG